jgi:ribonuclease P protein component
MAAVPPRHGFPRQSRLLNQAHFDRVYAQRQRVADSFFTVNYAPNPGGTARLGLSVGAKTAGNAVSRNRIKRQVRDSFRLHAATLPAVDLVVGARPAVRTAHNARLRESLTDLWNRVSRLCAASSAD